LAELQDKLPTSKGWLAFLVSAGSMARTRFTKEAIVMRPSLTLKYQSLISLLWSIVVRPKNDFRASWPSHGHNSFALWAVRSSRGTPTAAIANPIAQPLNDKDMPGRSSMLPSSIAWESFKPLGPLKRSDEITRRSFTYLMGDTVVYSIPTSSLWPV